MVEHHRISAKDQSRLQQCGKKALAGIFLGYVLIAGRFWKGDILVADIEELGKFGRVRNSCSKAQHKRSFNATKGWQFYLPNRRWNSKIVWKRSRCRGNHCKAGTTCKERRSQRRTSKKFGEVSTDRNKKMTLKPAMTFGQWKERSFIVITSTLEFGSTCRKKKHSVFHWEYIDVIRSTHTDLDVWQEKRIEDYWKVDSNRNLSDSWKGVTKFTLLKEKPPKRKMWSERDWKRFKQGPDQIMYGQKFGRKLVTPLRIEKNRNGQKKN